MTRAGSEAVPAEAAFSLQNAEIVQLTTTGDAALPAISPDGRYVAYVQRDSDEDSLWIRQTTTASNVQIGRRTRCKRSGRRTLTGGAPPSWSRVMRAGLLSRVTTGT
jgi:hypothetical protein